MTPGAHELWRAAFDLSIRILSILPSSFCTDGSDAGRITSGDALFGYQGACEELKEALAKCLAAVRDAVLDAVAAGRIPPAPTAPTIGMTVEDRVKEIPPRVSGQIVALTPLPDTLGLTRAKAGQ